MKMPTIIIYDYFSFCSVFWISFTFFRWMNLCFFNDIKQLILIFGNFLWLFLNKWLCTFNFSCSFLYNSLKISTYKAIYTYKSSITLTLFNRLFACKCLLSVSNFPVFIFWYLSLWWQCKALNHSCSCFCVKMWSHWI